jgi:hypothetical protein
MSESEGPTRENSVTVFSTSLAQRINSAFGSFRERKNKQADQNAVLSGVGALRVGSKGQLEVDKSIWDLTKGVQEKKEETSAFQQAWEAVCQDLKVRTPCTDWGTAASPLPWTAAPGLHFHILTPGDGYITRRPLPELCSETHWWPSYRWLSCWCYSVAGCGPYSPAPQRKPRTAARWRSK